MRKFIVGISTSILLLFGCGHDDSLIPQPFGGIRTDRHSVDLPPDSPPKNFSVLYSFRGPTDGSNPLGSLVRDAAGNLYGTTDGGGAQQDGTVFKVDPSGIETILLSFDVTDGLGPQAGLVLDTAGNLYGTTALGGDRHNADGVVFKLDPSGFEEMLHSFSGPDGNDLRAGLVRDSSGILYGTSYAGGSSQNCFGGCGVVFKIDSNGIETVLHSFNGTDGKYPVASLIRDTGGNLYGTTLRGGSSACYDGCGIVIKINKTGKEIVLHRFNRMDGEYPQAGLVLDAGGNLYGTTIGGGPQHAALANGRGLVFKIEPGGKETVLHSFSGIDGEYPFATLVQDATGNLYGTTSEGGSGVCYGFGCGVVFKLDSHGTETILHNFNGSDGDSPEAALIRDSAGNLYGTTVAGGSSNFGVVFKLTH